VSGARVAVMGDPRGVAGTCPGAAVLSSSPPGVGSTTFATPAEAAHATCDRGTRDGRDPHPRAHRHAGSAGRGEAARTGEAAGRDRGDPPAAVAGRGLGRVLLP